MSSICLVTIATTVLFVTLRTLGYLGSLPSKNATSSTSHITAVIAQSVVTDLTVCIFPPTGHSSACILDPCIWRRVEKDLYLHTSQRRAWLYVALANERELSAEDLLVTDIRVDDPEPSSGTPWESRSGGIWVLRSKFLAILTRL